MLYIIATRYDDPDVIIATIYDGPDGIHHDDPDVIFVAVNELPMDKMAAILQMTFSNAFSVMKYFVFRFEFY